MLSWDELQILISQARPLVISGRIQKVRSIGPERVRMQIYAGGEKHDLLWALDGPFPRVQLSFADVLYQAIPSTLAQQLKSRLEGSRIRNLELLSDDRIVRMDVESMENGVLTPLALLAELFPNRRNLYLLDSSDRIL
jgi:predicted ribosome quality control (RQC) complex YloA/Tae2 family protein